MHSLSYPFQYTALSCVIMCCLSIDTVILKPLLTMRLFDVEEPLGQPPARCQKDNEELQKFTAELVKTPWHETYSDELATLEPLGDFDIVSGSQQTFEARLRRQELLANRQHEEVLNSDLGFNSPFSSAPFHKFKARNRH
jgi:hypothetical protein